MMTPLSLELQAQDIIAQRVAEAQRQALIAQLPRTPQSAVSPFANARVHVARSLRQLARRLDPTFAVPERATHDRRLAVARSR